MNTIKSSFFYTYYIVALCLLLLSACTKEAAKLPYSEITSFSITDAEGKPLDAAIDGQDIIIYWPFEQSPPPDITPQITVSDQASVKPASGEKIAFSAATSYVVTAQNGHSVTYKIRIVSVQPGPVSSYLTADSYSFIAPGALGNFGAYYLVRDTSRTHLSLISGTGEKVPIQVDSVTRDKIYYRYPAALDTGRYKIMLETGSYTVTGKINLYYRPYGPEVEQLDKLALKQGQMFTLKGSYLNRILSAVMYDENFTEQNVEVIGNTATSVTLRLPADLPAGAYIGIAILDEYYTYKDYTGIELPIEVTP